MTKVHKKKITAIHIVHKYFKNITSLKKLPYVYLQIGLKQQIIIKEEALISFGNLI